MRCLLPPLMKCPSPQVLAAALIISTSLVEAAVTPRLDRLATRNTTILVAPKAAPGCFPGLGYTPERPNFVNLEWWWCTPDTEYAFVGFSYEVTACQSLVKLRREFLDIRTTFGGRYVRLYGACDRVGFYDDIVDAAWGAGIGVHALIWFGFDGNQQVWQRRRDALFSTLRNNAVAPFVTRTVQFGSEPLFDHAITPQELASQVKSAKAQLAPLGISVTVSELAYGFQSQAGAQGVLDAVDSVHAHILPFFSQKASTASASWPLIQSDISWFSAHAKGKKIYFSQCGWPSVTSQGVQPNSPKAVANVHNERDYYSLLDEKCAELKSRGVAWFAHIYADEQEPGYGIYDSTWKPKFNFRPKTTC